MLTPWWAAINGAEKHGRWRGSRCSWPASSSARHRAGSSRAGPGEQPARHGRPARIVVRAADVFCRSGRLDSRLPVARFPFRGSAPERSGTSRNTRQLPGPACPQRRQRQRRREPTLAGHGLRESGTAVAVSAGCLAMTPPARRLTCMAHRGGLVRKAPEPSGECAVDAREDFADASRRSGRGLAEDVAERVGQVQSGWPSNRGKYFENMPELSQQLRVGCDRRAVFGEVAV